MNIAVIPARGGSKRIPRKNIKLFHSKPIIAYSIECALASGCFDRIIVSTDDAEIADIARQYGAEVPFMRPAELADDYCGTLDVMAHAVSTFETMDMATAHICCIYPTAPLLLPEDLQRGEQILRSHAQIQYVFSAVAFGFPVQRAIYLNNEQEVSMFQPEHAKTRSQDLLESYHDAGQFYWGRGQAFLEKQPFFAPHSRIVELPALRVRDIDTPIDWEIAEFFYERLHPRHD
ncbi:pseudaminic acid cytidylyltransferase [Marinomonas gallaica]|uniref:pseudaminic acid cytidylyltransferase n=1 Tax=Marinomonas gallaica TaxID=1806667 RepID=UPI003CE5C86D